MLQASAQAVDFKVGRHFGEGQGKTQDPCTPMLRLMELIIEHGNSTSLSRHDVFLARCVKLWECLFGKVALRASRWKPRLLRTRRQNRAARGPAIVGQPKVDRSVFERQHQK